MTPARFADTLQIGRAVISHILNGRNNPSLEVVTRILSEFPQINSDWLISGNGSMYKSERGNQNLKNSTTISDQSNQNNFPQDLFAQNYTKPIIHQETKKYETENELTTPHVDNQSIVNERIIYKERPEKKISKIIIYYTDNTYETFNPEK